MRGRTSSSLETRPSLAAFATAARVSGYSKVDASACRVRAHNSRVAVEPSSLTNSFTNSEVS